VAGLPLEIRGGEMREEDDLLVEEGEQPRDGVSRRDFLKLGAVAVTVPAVVGPTVLKVAGEDVKLYGPGKAPVTLKVNGKMLQAELEPRVTLLDALRDHFDLTGSKRVCNHGECGACTLLMDGKSVYACSVLAIDAQGHAITTIEGITGTGLSPVSKAFVDNDAQQCGFCTPGFVMASTALLQRHPHPTNQQVIRGLSGNFCRCGTYYGMRGAMQELGATVKQLNKEGE
jgi:xanthine dehydrogenase YagT iron-sulfur-binding subunit